MRGKVKWFSQEKGFGFIVNEQGEDVFFGVRDVLGAELPSNVDEVEFEIRQGKKDPAASKVVIKSKTKSEKPSNQSGETFARTHCRVSQFFKRAFFGEKYPKSTQSAVFVGRLLHLSIFFHFLGATCLLNR